MVAVRAAAQDTPLTVLGHESGHLFLAFASIPDPRGPDRQADDRVRRRALEFRVQLRGVAG